MSTTTQAPARNRYDVEAELAVVTAETRRLSRIVSNGLYPSQWDEGHARIDQLLTEWERFAKTAPLGQNAKAAL